VKREDTPLLFHHFQDVFISEGDTKEEAIANIKEAIELYLEPVEDDQSFSPNAECIELSV